MRSANRWMVVMLVAGVFVVAVAVISTRREQRPKPIGVAVDARVIWRAFGGGVFAPKNGAPIVDALPATCEPCDYVHLRYEIPSLYECASTVTQDCIDANRKRNEARKTEAKRRREQ